MLAAVHPTTIAVPQTLAGLNPLDWALVVLVGASTFLAFLRGLIRSLISAFGVVLGIVLAAWYAPELALWLGRWVPQPAMAEAAAFLLVVAATYLAAVLIGRLLRGAAQAVGLGLVDRLGGAAFGFGRAVLVLAALLIPATPFLHTVPYTRDSALLPYLQSAAHGVSFVMPQDFGKRLLAGASRRRLPSATETNIEGEAQ